MGCNTVLNALRKIESHTSGADGESPIAPFAQTTQHFYMIDASVAALLLHSIGANWESLCCLLLDR
jgi:hypothetical protein